jgi:hypothetical protein
LKPAQTLRTRLACGLLMRRSVRPSIHLGSYGCSLFFRHARKKKGKNPYFILLPRTRVHPFWIRSKQKRTAGPWAVPWSPPPVAHLYFITLGPTLLRSAAAVGNLEGHWGPRRWHLHVVLMAQQHGERGVPDLADTDVATGAFGNWRAGLRAPPTPAASVGTWMVVTRRWTGRTRSRPSAGRPVVRLSALPSIMTPIAVPSWQQPASSCSIPPSIWIKYDADRPTWCPRRRLFCSPVRSFRSGWNLQRFREERWAGSQGYGVQSILLYFYFPFRGENQRSSRATEIAVGCIMKGWVARIVASSGKPIHRLLRCNSSAPRISLSLVALIGPSPLRGRAFPAVYFFSRLAAPISSRGVRSFFV